MGYWSTVIDPLFKTGTNGERIVYPYGVFPKGVLTFGYIVTSDQELSIKKFIKTWWLLFIISSSVVFGILDVFINELYSIMVYQFLYGIFLVIFYIFWIRSLLKDAPRSSEKYPMKEAYKVQEKTIGIFWSSALVVWSSLMFLAVVFLFSYFDFALAIFLLLISGAFVIRSFFLLRGALVYRKKSTSQPSSTPQVV